MDIAIIGTGFIGTTLGRALVGAGQNVTFGSRHAGDGVGDVDVVGADVVSAGDAIARSDALILALPGPAVGELASAHASGLAATVVIDATNQMGAAVANSRSALPSTVRYARAFNTLGGENMADPSVPVQSPGVLEHEGQLRRPRTGDGHPGRPERHLAARSEGAVRGGQSVGRRVRSWADRT